MASHYQTIIFTLAGDYYGIKYFDKADAESLFSALRKKFTTVDWTGSTYLGLNINWDSKMGYVDISMSDSVPEALEIFDNQPPPHPQHALHICTHGQKAQYAD